MAVKSMTGYASRDGSLQLGAVDYRWTWDIRSVNGKSLDLRLRVPSLFNDLEQTFRRTLAKKIGRGNVNASLSLTTTRKDGGLVVNEDILQTVLALSKRLSDEHGVAPLTADGVLGVKGVLEVADDSGDTSNDELKAALTSSFEAVIDDLSQSRANEGQALSDILTRILSEAETIVATVKDAPERKADRIKEKLRNQIADLVGNGTDFSEERLHQEALLLATKADVQEEIDRLEAHIASARDLLQSKEPVGRRLDFLSQEFNREANTLCSKANDVVITNLGLGLKNAIDQFREQVQNVE